MLIFDFLKDKPKPRKVLSVGRPSKGAVAMTNAQRQKAYRERKKRGLVLLRNVQPL